MVLAAVGADCSLLLLIGGSWKSCAALRQLGTVLH